jgi:multidrug efflux pump subunit AcrA (membrane-fusion protein)
LWGDSNKEFLAIRFKEGSKVKKGDLLVKINDAGIKAQLRKIEYQLKLSEAREFRQKTLAERDVRLPGEAESGRNGRCLGDFDRPLGLARFDPLQIGL